MYTNKYFEETDRSTVLSFMRRYPFAIIVNTENGIPIATHLPFIIEEKNNKLLLLSHFATANAQAKHLLNSTTLVIFSAPNAYISPGNYEQEKNVPTWNYIAVHAYGKTRLIEDESGKFNLLNKTIQRFEAGYQQQWDGLTENYKSNMLKGIVGFEVEINDIQATFKLSQNRTDRERDTIIGELSKSPDPGSRAIANEMKGIR